MRPSPPIAARDVGNGKQRLPYVLGAIIVDVERRLLSSVATAPRYRQQNARSCAPGRRAPPRPRHAAAYRSTESLRLRPIVTERSSRGRRLSDASDCGRRPGRKRSRSIAPARQRHSSCPPGVAPPEGAINCARAASASAGSARQRVGFIDHQVGWCASMARSIKAVGCDSR